MLLLVSTSDVLQVVTGSALGTDIHASYDDYNGTTVTPGRLNTQVSTAATTTVVPSPGSNVQRNVKLLTVRNTGASNNVITVQHSDGTHVITMALVTLQPGDALHYDEEVGFWVIDLINNSIQATTIPIWKLIGVTVISTVGANTFFTNLRTNNIRLRLLGGGGGGGGAATSSSTAAAGGGGAAGSYLEVHASISPGTAYSCVVGSAGTAGVAGQNNGGAGGNTTFTIGGTTYTAQGGNGGIGSPATTAGVVPGGASGGTPTNGEVNSPGEPGGPGLTLSGSVPVSGYGGSSIWGGGAKSISGTGGGSAGVGFGSGGCGGSTTGASKAGGAGTQGLIVIEEYT